MPWGGVATSCHAEAEAIFIVFRASQRGGLGWIDIDLVCSHEKRFRKALGDSIWLLTEEPTSIFYIDVATTDRRPFHIRHPRAAA